MKADIFGLADFITQYEAICLLRFNEQDLSNILNGFARLTYRPVDAKAFMTVFVERCYTLNHFTTQEIYMILQALAALSFKANVDYSTDFLAYLLRALATLEEKYLLQKDEEIWKRQSISMLAWWLSVLNVDLTTILKLPGSKSVGFASSAIKAMVE